MATTAYHFKFTTNWNQAVYDAYGAGTPALETAVRNAVSSMRAVQLAQRGIQVLRQTVTVDGQQFLVSLARDAAAYTRFLA